MRNYLRISSSILPDHSSRNWLSSCPIDPFRFIRYQIVKYLLGLYVSPRRGSADSLSCYGAKRFENSTPCPHSTELLNGCLSVLIPKPLLEG